MCLTSRDSICTLCAPLQQALQGKMHLIDHKSQFFYGEIHFPDIHLIPVLPSNSTVVCHYLGNKLYCLAVAMRVISVAFLYRTENIVCLATALPKLCLINVCKSACMQSLVRSWTCWSWTCWSLQTGGTFGCMRAEPKRRVFAYHARTSMICWRSPQKVQEKASCGRRFQFSYQLSTKRIARPHQCAMCFLHQGIKMSKKIRWVRASNSTASRVSTEVPVKRKFPDGLAG